MSPKILVLFAVFAVTFALPQYGYQPREQKEPAQYNFDWTVRDDYSRVNYGQQESRSYDNTKGSYYVDLPDGRRQKVTYYVNGDSGFVAEVTYEGEARYPSPKPRYQNQNSRQTYNNYN